MNKTRHQLEIGAERGRSHALGRFTSLVDPTLDDLTRELQMQIAVSQFDTPARVLDLDGTILDGNDALVALDIERDTVRGRAVWAIDAWDLADLAAILAPLVDAGS